jgi:hypothetical protein
MVFGFIGSWLLAFGFWLLAFGFWLLVFGFWLFFGLQFTVVEAYLLNFISFF